MQIYNYSFYKPSIVLSINIIYIIHSFIYIWNRLPILPCDSYIELKFNRSLIFKILAGKNKFFNSIVI